MFSKTSKFLSTFRSTTMSPPLGGTVRQPSAGADPSATLSSTKGGKGLALPSITMPNKPEATSSTSTSPSKPMMTGYLIRKETNAAGWIMWKKRLFVLERFALVYYKKEGLPSGDIMLNHRMTVHMGEQEGHKYCLLINSPLSRTIYLATDSAQEREKWYTALKDSIAKLGQSANGYLKKKVSSGKNLGYTERFYVLHDSKITGHETHLARSEPVEVIEIDTDTVIKFDIAKVTICITTGTDEAKKTVRLKCPTINEFSWWKKHLTGVIKSPSEAEDNPPTPKMEPEAIIMAGFLNTRPLRVAGDWNPMYYTLTEHCLTQYESQNKKEALNVFIFNVNCSVFETKLYENSFELVTPGNVLHIAATDRESMLEWEAAIQERIEKCELERWDPLCREALKRPDEFYEVTFKDKGPLGMVLERSGTWAIVKVSTSDEVNVQAGSAINAINGKSVILNGYRDTIKQLMEREPPLTIGFRRSPSKSGWLTKQSRVGYAKPTNWKQRFVVLREGHLVFYDSEAEGAVVKGDVKLMGCAVTLVPYAEGRVPHFCFRLISSLTVITLMASSQEHMMEWASTLYHAVGIANGGGYLLAKERRRPGGFERSMSMTPRAALETSRTVALETSRTNEERKQVEAAMEMAKSQGISFTKSLELARSTRLAISQSVAGSDVAASTNSSLTSRSDEVFSPRNDDNDGVFNTTGAASIIAEKTLGASVLGKSSVLAAPIAMAANTLGSSVSEPLQRSLASSQQVDQAIEQALIQTTASVLGATGILEQSAVVDAGTLIDAQSEVEVSQVQPQLVEEALVSQAVLMATTLGSSQRPQEEVDHEALDRSIMTKSIGTSMTALPLEQSLAQMAASVALSETGSLVDVADGCCQTTASALGQSFALGSTFLIPSVMEEDEEHEALTKTSSTALSMAASTSSEVMVRSIGIGVTQNLPDEEILTNTIAASSTLAQSAALGGTLQASVKGLTQTAASLAATGLAVSGAFATSQRAQTGQDLATTTATLAQSAALEPSLEVEEPSTISQPPPEVEEPSTIPQEPLAAPPQEEEVVVEPEPVVEPMATSLREVEAPAVVVEEEAVAVASLIPVEPFSPVMEGKEEEDEAEAGLHEEEKKEQGSHFTYNDEADEQDKDSDDDGSDHEDALLHDGAVPMIVSPRGVMVEDQHRDDDDDENDVVEMPPASSLASCPLPHSEDPYDDVPTSDFMDSVPQNRTDLFQDFSPLTTEQIMAPLQVMSAFENGTHMKPLHFSQFVRLVTSKRNLYFEMDTFYRYFQSDNGYVTLDRFMDGVRRLEEEQPSHSLIQGIKNYSKESLVAL